MLTRPENEQVRVVLTPRILLSSHEHKAMYTNRDLSHSPRGKGVVKRAREKKKEEANRQNNG